MTLVDPSTGEVVKVQTIPVDSVMPGPSIRRDRIDLDHVARMEGAVAELPPIVVRKVDNGFRLIDGHHRLTAHKHAGQIGITAVVVDLDDEHAWLEAVRANISHGLVLDFGERQTAARKAVAKWPHLSDRAIAEACGISHPQVAKLRPSPCPTGNGFQLDTPKREGKDGKQRPANSAEQRERIREQIKAQPDASDREVARQTGASPSTVGKERGHLSAVPDPSDEVTVGDLLGPRLPDVWVKEPACTRSNAAREFAKFMDRRRVRDAKDEDPAALAAGCPMELRESAISEAGLQVQNWQRLLEALRDRNPQMEGVS